MIIALAVTSGKSFAVADLHDGFLKGGFSFRQIMAIACIVTSWHARRHYVSMHRLQSNAQSVENFGI